MAIELLEFWATGCKQSLPCHQAVEQLQTANDIGMTIRSIDAWDAPIDVAAHRILQLPTLLLLSDGVELASSSQPHPTPAAITAWIVEHLPQQDVSAATTAPRTSVRTGASCE